jgi:16S rRNA (guanine1516-N2)-methyltransferase
MWLNRIMPHVIPIICPNRKFYSRAVTISQRVNSGNVLVKDAEAKSSSVYSLQIDENGVSLINSNLASHGPVKVDFVNGSIGHRRRYGGGTGQAIAKAVGVSGVFLPSILDLTAGLGTDGFVLASLGCTVELVERNPIISCLLEDGIRRAIEYAATDEDLMEIIQRVNFTENESIDFLSNLSEAKRADIICLDPMFPRRQKAAKVKKEMQAFQSIVGEDSDAEGLLVKAINAAKYRVVVKRPGHSEFLGQLKPTYSLKGKSTRFDIYVNKAIPK